MFQKTVAYNAWHTAGAQYLQISKPSLWKSQWLMSFFFFCMNRNHLYHSNKMSPKPNLQKFFKVLGVESENLDFNSILSGLEFKWENVARRSKWSTVPTAANRSNKGWEVTTGFSNMELVILRHFSRMAGPKAWSEWVQKRMRHL